MAHLNWNFSLQKRIRSNWFALSTLTFLACVHAFVWRQSLLEQRDQTIAEMTEISHRIGSHKPVASPTPRPDLSAVFAEMRFPWMDMLNSLNRATPSDVRLLTLESDGSPVRRIRISGMANRAQDLMEFVEALQNDHAWSDIQLDNQTRTGDRTTPRPISADIPTLPGPMTAGVSFSLTAEWARP